MAAEKKLCVNELGCLRQNKALFAPISFQLNPGEVLLVEGPNGSGKSSLLRMLAGLLTPSLGEIRWQQQRIQDDGSEYAKVLHFIGHTNGIKLGLNVMENLQLAHHLSSTSHHDKTLLLTQINTVLLSLQLSAYQDTQARYLSAGQKRRLSLAKLFLFQKPLWIVDEPLTALDVTTQALFLSWVEAHVTKGGIAIMSTHHPIQLNSISIQTLRLSAC
jgi:heme exporter protein A